MKKRGWGEGKRNPTSHMNIRQHGTSSPRPLAEVSLPSRICGNMIVNKETVDALLDTSRLQGCTICSWRGEEVILLGTGGK